MKRAADFGPGNGGAWKNARKPPATIEDIRETAAQGITSESPGSSKSALNMALQKLYRRPVVKADLVVTLTKGPPDLLQMSVPALGLAAEVSQDSINKEEQKKQEEALAKSINEQLVEAIDLGELTARDEAMPAAEPQLAAPAQARLSMPSKPSMPTPKAPTPKAPGMMALSPPVEQPNKENDFKSPLNTALQKLIGGPVTKEDRTFTVDMEGGSGSLEFKQLKQCPGFRVDCQFDPILGSKEDLQSSKNSVEHQLAEMALTELTNAGLLVYDASKPRLQAWSPPDSAVVPMPGGRSEPPLSKLRLMQDGFASKPPDEYKEQVSCRREGGRSMWNVTISLQGQQTGGRPVQGLGRDANQEKAREMAASAFFTNLERPSGAKGKAGGKTATLVQPASYQPAAAKGGKGFSYQPAPVVKGYGKGKSNGFKGGW